MRNINLFVEDRGHTLFLQTLIYRFANQYGISINIKISSSSGGHGAVLSKLKEYIADLLHEQGILPDLLIAATDGNCKGMDLDYLEHSDESLGKLLKELRQIFQQWQRSEQAGMQELHENAAPYILDADANNLQA